MEPVEIMRIDGHFEGPTRVIRTSEELTQRIEAEADRRNIYSVTLTRDLINLVTGIL